MSLMIFQSLLLFLSALLGGTTVLLITKPNQYRFQQINVLSGGYLFAITVLHILPELFAMPAPSQHIGLYLLIGFFFQLFLELMSKGVEHGHMDSHAGHTTPMSLLLALVVHAFLDGFILSTPHEIHAHQHVHAHGPTGLLIGILLHKVPVSFAFTSVLSKELRSRRTILLYLFLFAISSPVGLWCSHYGGHYIGDSADILVAMWGIAAGSFLHIATTIFFEASPDHDFNLQKFLASLFGASLAVVFELLL